MKASTEVVNHLGEPADRSVRRSGRPAVVPAAGGERGRLRPRMGRL
jgi:hypothetical protein